MTKPDLNKFLRVLGARRMELERTTCDREVLAIDTSPDDLDRIQKAAVRELANAQLERESNRLRDVQAALQRIDTGAFGVCVDCNEDKAPSLYGHPMMQMNVKPSPPYDVGGITMGFPSFAL